MYNEVSKNLPLELRPYERCLKNGPEVLNDAELLAVILRTGCVGENSVSLAAGLLQLGDLEHLVSLSVPELTSVRGIGKVKAIQLQCVGELARRISAKDAYKIRFNSPQSVADCYLKKLSGESREQVYLLLLDSKGALIKELLLSKGTVNRSLLSAREVFVEAQRYKAVNIILLHNHPSGDPTPSEDDVSITRKIIRAGLIVDIPLIDHIILGRDDYISLKERGIFDERQEE